MIGAAGPVRPGYPGPLGPGMATGAPAPWNPSGPTGPGATGPTGPFGMTGATGPSLEPRREWPEEGSRETGRIASGQAAVIFAAYCVKQPGQDMYAPHVQILCALGEGGRAQPIGMIGPEVILSRTKAADQVYFDQACRIMGEASESLDEREFRREARKAMRLAVMRCLTVLSSRIPDMMSPKDVLEAWADGIALDVMGS